MKTLLTPLFLVTFLLSGCSDTPQQKKAAEKGVFPSFSRRPDVNTETSQWLDSWDRDALLGTWRTAYGGQQGMSLEFLRDGNAVQRYYAEELVDKAFLSLIGTIHYKWWIKRSVIHLEMMRADGPIAPLSEWAVVGNISRHQILGFPTMTLQLGPNLDSEGMPSRRGGACGHGSVSRFEFTKD